VTVDPEGRRRIGFALGALVLLLAFADVVVPLAENTWIYRDGRFYVNVNENLLDAGSLQDPFAHSWYSGTHGWNHDLPHDFSNVALGRNGEYWHFRPWILPVVSTPFYWAFGLFGLLLFNLVGLAAIAFGSFRFAREYASDHAAALAAVGLVLAGGVRARAYDYSVDVLLLAFFCLGLTALVSRRGFWAGLLLGLGILIKPPVIVFAIPWALILWEREDLDVLKSAILGGAVSLGIGAAMNTYMFGRPWWFGYSRVLHVVRGEPAIFNDVEAFSTPWEVGLPDMWRGEWGVARRWGAFALALLGHAAMLRRHPRYVVGTVLVSVGLFLLFSRFPWRYDRFLFPAFAMSVPALAAGLEVCGRGLRWLGARVRGASLSPAAAMAATLAVAGALASFGTTPGLTERMGDSAYLTGARAFAGDVELAAVASEMSSMSRFDSPIPRVSLPVVPVAGVAALGGDLGLLILHLLLGATLVYFAARFASRLAPPPIAATAAVGVALLPPVSEAMIRGGQGLYAAALMALGFVLVHRRRWVRGGVVLVVAAWMADAMLLAFTVPLYWAYVERVRDKRLAWIGVALGAWAVVTLVVIGRPFASPDDFVIVTGFPEPMAIPDLGFFDAGRAAWEAPAPNRAMLPLLVVAALGAALAWRRDPVAASLMSAGILSVLVPGAATESGAWSPVLAVPVVAGVACAANGLVGISWDRRRAWGGVAGGLVLLGLWGAVSRTMAASAPFEIASARGVRGAEVTLVGGRGDVPCDFLAWELMMWECAVLDGGGHNRTGLLLPGGVQVAGESGFFLIPTALRRPRSKRSVAWSVEATDTLVLRVGAPDGPYDGDALLRVRVDGEELRAIEVPRGRNAEDLRIDTSAYAGREVRLELVMEPARGRMTAVAVKGGFR